MATDKQIDALIRFRRGLSDLASRRSEWQSAAKQIARILEERVKELKKETDFALVFQDHGAHDERTLQLGMGRWPIRQGGEQTVVESGAQLVIGLATSGYVRFTFVQSFIGKDDHADRETLGIEEPDEAALKVDDYITAFLERAVKTHCSTRKR
jgi:hypothetical protein